MSIYAILDELATSGENHLPKKCLAEISLRAILSLCEKVNYKAELIAFHTKSSERNKICILI